MRDSLLFFVWTLLTSIGAMLCLLNVLMGDWTNLLSTLFVSMCAVSISAVGIRFMNAHMEILFNRFMES